LFGKIDEAITKKEEYSRILIENEDEDAAAA
jgi:hypothetical protein